jgi:hypothetical protein
VDLSLSGMLAGLLASGIGFVLFRYGKSNSRMPQLIAGLVLMAGPMFAPNAWWDLSGCALVLLALWVALRAGC